jgi:hypothetical protein
MARKRPSRILPSLFGEGISKMIVLKLAALVIGAGVLVSVFTPNFDADLILAIIACFS